MTDQQVTAAGDAIVAVDATGTITAWNPAAERLLGHRAEQAIGQTLALIVPPEHRARHAAAFHSAMDGRRLAHQGRPARIEAQRADGAVVPLVFTLGLLDADNRAGGVVAILREDIDPISFI